MLQNVIEYVYFVLYEAEIKLNPQISKLIVIVASMLCLISVN